jgi:BirA family biotin operon repressor/biotin-[acetyl-CoA-carboxylase] ligase
LPDPISRNPLGIPFIELKSVDSTNNYALERIHAGLASHGAAFFTHEQVAGKGQRGKTWLTEKSSSLIVSVVIKPGALLLSQQFQLSACTAVSVCEFFRQYAGDETVIKWPNDLYWQDRKAGGILIENVIGTTKLANSGSRLTNQQLGMSQSSSWQWAVIGIGININQPAFDPALKNPVSLKQITGSNFNTLELAKELCFILDRNYRVLSEEGFETIYHSYNLHLYKKNQLVRFKKGARSFEALVKKVSPEGALVVQHAIEEEFSWGELEWVIS